MRLTALWALSESGLGGIMHAFKIPFTGFFLGGFAIVVITLLALNSNKCWRDITQATLLVILIKATASPQSPPMAYIAVAFQGFAGALIFSLIRNKRLAAMCFGCIALFESAVQKFLVTTIIFGNSIWEAMDLFFMSIAKDLSLAPEFSFSLWLIASYTLVYSVWGIIVGNWASLLPKKMNAKAPFILDAFRKLKYHNVPASEQIKGKRVGKYIVTFFMLLFIISTFLMLGSGHKAIYAIARTIGALLILFFIINPFVKWLMQLWIDKVKRKQDTKISPLLNLLPELKNLVTPAMMIARSNSSGWRVYKEFVFALIVLTLFLPEN